MDASLARLARQGDREAFGRLVRRYGPQARRIALTILGNQQDADDAAQDGFLAALSNMGTFDETRPFGPWLLKIVANAARDLARKRSVRLVESIPDDAASTARQPDEQASLAELGETLNAALRMLPERQRIAVVLYHVEGYNHREIGEILELPPGTVRSDVHHARQGLRKTLAAWREENKT